MRYAIEIDQASMAEALRLLEYVGGNARQAMSIAINKTARLARSSKAMEGGGASQRIRANVRLQAGYVNERLTLKTATRADLKASIKTPSRGLLLSNYATNLSSFGMPPRVKVKPGGPTKKVGRHPDIKTDPFYMILPKSNVIAIVGRRKEPGPRGGKIKVLMSRSVSQEFDNVKDDLTPVANDRLAVELEDAIDYLLRRRMPPES